jgi:tetrahydromethanopterin S-methyltransferase subunit G
MKTVFEPSNALEGHMIQDLLKQRGISSRLDGAGLQGAVGELPAIGLVRLVVEDDDFQAARAVIDDWERSSAPDPVATPAPQRIGALVGGIIGLLIGIGATAAYFRAPVNAEGIDHNEDGVLDEHWLSSAGGTPIRTESDRNFDGEIDVVWNYDGSGRIESGESDDDFDGRFESRFRYARGQMYVARTDTDGDTVPDMTTHAAFGVLDTVEYATNDSDRPVRVEKYRLGKLVSADVDTDRDGTLDRRQVYGAFGEVKSVEGIGPSVTP